MGLKGLTNWIQREQVMKTHPFTLTNTKLRYKCSDPADMEHTGTNLFADGLLSHTKRCQTKILHTILWPDRQKIITGAGLQKVSTN